MLCYVISFYFILFLVNNIDGFRFIAKLSEKYRDFLYSPAPKPQAQSAPSPISPPPPAHEPSLTHHYHPTTYPVAYLRARSGAAHSMGLGKCRMTHIYPYGVMQTTCTALKFPCALPAYSFVSLTPGNHCSFYCCLTSAFSRMSWNCSFLFSAEYCFLVWTDHTLLTHSLNEGHPACSQELAVMEKAAVNTLEQVFV